MKYITQILYILFFSALGEFLQTVIPLPIPAAVYGLVLLLIALCTGVVKEQKVAEVSSFLISILPVLFVPPAVNILRYWNIISPHIAAICIIVPVSTVIIFAVSGLVTKWLQSKKEGRKND